jgi:hypothetical protein
VICGRRFPLLKYSWMIGEPILLVMMTWCS